MEKKIKILKLMCHCFTKTEKKKAKPPPKISVTEKSCTVHKIVTKLISPFFPSLQLKKAVWKCQDWQSQKSTAGAQVESRDTKYKTDVSLLLWMVQVRWKIYSCLKTETELSSWLSIPFRKRRWTKLPPGLIEKGGLIFPLSQQVWKTFRREFAI